MPPDAIFCVAATFSIFENAFQKPLPCPARGFLTNRFFVRRCKPTFSLKLLLDTTQTMSDAAVNAVLHDMLRTELNRIIRGQNAPSTDIAAVDAQIAELQAKAERLRQNAHLNHFSDTVREIEPLARQP